MTTTETTSAVVDLTDFLPQDTAVIEVVAPGGRQIGWFVTLAGPAHPKTIAASDAAARKALHRSKLIEQAQVNGKKYVADERSPEETRRENVQGVVARIVDWTPIKIGPTVFEFSDAKAVDLLVRPDMGWAYVQIAEAQADDTRFTKASAKA